ncbi:Ig-like domain-containing protein, partial [Flavobacterium notoginsengisoli]
MRNFTLSQSGFFRLIFFVLFVLTPLSLFAQVCGTPGVDGPVAVTNSVNTYYPINGNVTLNAGAQSILLGSVPTADSHNNSFGTIPISVGDLILIIQMQDATINYSNSANYGSGTSNSGPDYLGGTGFTALGNTGIFEYVIATSNVPLGGGNLTFKGTGIGGGAFNSFFNANATTTRGKRTFQVIRVPQYSNLTLTANITTPPYNGAVGGVIAFNVSGTFNFAGYSIDGSARGFRGGYSPRAGSGVNDATTYVGEYTRDNISGKGEGIAGTPKYMWDGFNQVVNAEEGLPGGSSGRGAAANAGGGGNDHNTGGGGGGNGGFGGLGGAGWQGGGGAAYPDLTGAGRPGSKSYITTTTFPRLIMGGGGGAGDANDASSGVKGGVGGAIILVNAGNVLGDGFIYANGGNGAPGTYSGSPDGAGGGGAGGTVLLNVSNNSTSNIHVEAKGGAGGNTENDANNEHGPGGGGGGGIVCHNLSGTVTITSNVLGGAAGKSNAGNGITHGAKDGQEGYTSTFTVADVPPNLQVNANCFPVLGTTVKTLTTTSVCNSIDEKISYEIQIKNTGAGNAAGVVLDFSFPTGIEFDSATAAYSTDASGPSGALTNTATANNPVFGGFNIAQNGVVTITLVGKVAASISSGAHSSNAQALYLDPTRTTANSTRRITAFTNGYGTANKTYEGANQANVPGLNFNGNSTTADDITILALPVAPTATVTQTTCSVPTGRITVNTPANGTGISYTLVGTNPVTTPISNTTGVFSGLIPGTYTLTTTNAQGCTSSPNTGIVINTVADAPTVTGVTICQDGTGSLTATSACGAPNSTGAKMAGTGSSVNGTGTLVWSNPSQVISNNSSYAYATVNSGGDTTVITRYLQGTNFDFNIPTNATITGIQVTIGRYGSVNSASVYVRDNIVSLIKGGSVTSQNKSIGTNWSTNSTSVSNYGGTSDLWGTTWTPTEINDSTFGIALSASITRTRNNDITANVDYMQITVNYTVGGIEWYTTATGGSSIYTGASFNPVGVTGSGLTSTSTPGTRTYYASCPGTTNCRAAANFVINPRPTITGTTPTLRCGAGSVTLGASASTGTINWYATPTSTVSLGTGTSFTTPSLTTTTSYYVDATDNGCTTSTRTEVKATINTIPTINSTTEASRCGTGSVTLKATASTGTINWYATPTSTTSLGTGTDFTTESLSATTTYYVDVITAAGCSASSRIAVTAVINTASTIVRTSGTQNPTVCAGASIPTTVYTFGGSASNAIVSNLPAGLSSVVDTNAKTVTISGTPTVGGTYTITTAGHTSPCTEATISGTVTVNPTPSAPSASAQSFCSADNRTVGNLTATGTGIKWYTASTGGTALSSSTVLTSRTYYASQTSADGCESSRTAVVVTVNPTPSAPSASAQSFCSADNRTVGNLTATGTGIKWYTASTGGTALSSSTVLTSRTYYASQTSADGCESSRTAVVVTVNPTPSAPSASAQSFCSADNRTVGNLTATGTSIKWYTASTGGTALSSSTVLTSRTYYASQTSADGCESSRTAVVVTVNPTPSAPSASAQSFCSADNRTVGNLTATGTSIKWYTASTGGSALAVSDVLTSRTYYASQTSADGCESSRTAVVVTVNPTPSAPSASAQSFCSADNRTVGNLTATGTSIKWYTASTGGSALAVSDVLTSRTYYASQTSADGCESSRTAVVVTVNSTPSAPTVAAQTFCSSENKTIADLASLGASYKWYSALTGGTALAGTTVLATGTYYVSQSSNGCESTRSSVSVTVNATPSAPTVAAQTFCSSENKTIADLASLGASYKWYSALTGGTALAGTTVLATGTYYVSQSSNGCESTRASVSVTVNATPSAPTVAAQTFCSSENKTIADLASLGASYKWYSALTGGSALAGTTVLATGTYYVSQSSNGCESTRSSVSVTVNATPSAPTVAAQTFCSSENKTIGDLASLGASYKWYSALTGGTALAGTTVLATGTYYVSQSSNGCE